ncbi:MAG: hypothetical protein HWN68_13885 [Desulfobacterales bacterium]|nr:hypothetical protein [Desulfobacterales bacterium]
MDDKTKISLAAIGCLAGLETVALLKGVNGTLFSLVAAVIGGIAGYKLKIPTVTEAAKILAKLSGKARSKK